MICSRYRFAKDGEKPTKYYLNLEKKNFQAKIIHRLKIRDKLVENRQQILEEIKQYYEKLYTAEETINLDYLDKLEMPIISEIDKTNLNQPISLNELSAALRDLPNDKTPGTDGLTSNFYKVFWGKLKHLFHELVEEIISTGEFHLTAKYGILSLLEKVGKDGLIIKNWWPLTLLNTDNKIYTKTVANRMKAVLPSIIYYTQTGFMKGRYLAENVMKIMQVIQHCEDTQQNGLLVSFDFEKAFDTVSWPALFHTFRKLNFGNSFIQMVQVIFTNPMVCAYNNGYWSNFFYPTRGCQQGCCFSPSGFNVIAETIGHAIRNNVDIKGIKIGDSEILAGQFADDLWTTLFPTKQNLDAVLTELDNFGKFSGLKTNHDKCVVLKIGPWRHTDAKFYTMKKLFWSPKSIRILGIYIHPDWTIMYHNNYIEILDKVQDIIDTWSTRTQTIRGKITVINCLINTLFIHKFLALPSPPEGFFRIFRQMVTKYFWGDKPPKIAYTKLIQDYDRLGLKLVDLRIKDLALKAAWPARWTNRPQEELDWFFQKLPVRDGRIWECNLDPKDIDREYKLEGGETSDVAVSILRAWCQMHYNPVFEENDEILTTNIWGNSLIRKGDRPIFEKSLINSKINKVIDIYDLARRQFYTYQQVIDLFGMNLNQLLYNTIVSAIPRLSRILLKQSKIDEPIKENSVYDTICQQKQCAKYIYWKILEKQHPHCIESKINWEIDLDCKIDDDSWTALYPVFRKLIMPIKLQYFQYRVLTRKLTTNAIRAKWDQMVPSTCSLCNMERETIVHLFHDCKEIKVLWRNLRKCCKYYSSINVEFTKQTIILNNYNGKNKELINLLIVVMKQHIYAEKCKQNHPNFPGFMAKVSEWYEIDKILAIEHQKYKKFQKKWEGWF